MLSTRVKTPILKEVRIRFIVNDLNYNRGRISDLDGNLQGRIIRRSM